MPTKPDIPEIWIVPAENAAESQRASRAARQGTVRRIFPGLYTGNLDEPLELIVRRNLYQIIGALYPGAVLSHRTAFHGGGARDGHVYATYKYTRNIRLTADTIVHLLQGPGPQPEDIPLPHAACMSSEPRMCLENLQTSRARNGAPGKAVSRGELEERLLRILATRGEDGLNKLRDSAGATARRLGWSREWRRLDRLIGGILGSNKTPLTTPAARAQARGLAYDVERVAAFDRLAAYLRTEPLPRYSARAATSTAVANAAFFEAYFSNFIEGTEFDVGEAKSFVLDGVQPRSRPDDAHDIIGTYQLIIRANQRARLPRDSGDFLGLLRERHEILMSQRPDKRPGQFKEIANRAGNTYFVAPELVRGTLHEGLLRRASIPDPLGRAAYMMFLVSEVHPFDDGNGRVARLFMNAELAAEGLARIIIPTVYRDDYMSAMRTITRNHDDAAYLRMLTRAQDFSRRLEFFDYDRALRQLQAANAFHEPDMAKLAMPAAK